MSSAGSPVAKYVIAAVVILGVPGAVIAYRLANPPASTQITPVPSASTAVATSRVELEVSSPTRGAEVTVAGERHTVPWTGDMPTSTSEIDIELTAPGFAGRRFRVVMDRPRRLSFALPPGSGVANATLEELDQALNSDDDELLALGPDAGEDAGARRAAALARRAAAAAAASASTAPTATHAVAVQPTATVTATATATATATTAPTPTETATATAVPTATQAAPTVAPGTIETKQVRAVIKAHSAEAAACYDRAKMETPTLAGKLTIEATVSPTGQVQSAQVSNTDIRSPRLESCLVAAFRTFTFPAPAGGVPGTVTYTYVFKD